MCPSQPSTLCCKCALLPIGTRGHQPRNVKVTQWSCHTRPVGQGEEARLRSLARTQPMQLNEPRHGFGLHSGCSLGTTVQPAHPLPDAGITRLYLSPLMFDVHRSLFRPGPQPTTIQKPRDTAPRYGTHSCSAVPTYAEGFSGARECVECNQVVCHPACNSIHTVVPACFAGRAQWGGVAYRTPESCVRYAVAEPCPYQVLTLPMLAVGIWRTSPVALQITASTSDSSGDARDRGGRQ